MAFNTGMQVGRSTALQIVGHFNTNPKCMYPSTLVIDAGQGVYALFVDMWSIVLLVILAYTFIIFHVWLLYIILNGINICIVHGMWPKKRHQEKPGWWPVFSLYQRSNFWLSCWFQHWCFLRVKLHPFPFWIVCKANWNHMYTKIRV